MPNAVTLIRRSDKVRHPTSVIINDGHVVWRCTYATYVRQNGTLPLTSSPKATSY